MGFDRSTSATRKRNGSNSVYSTKAHPWRNMEGLHTIPAKNSAVWLAEELSNDAVPASIPIFCTLSPRNGVPTYEV